MVWFNNMNSMLTDSLRVIVVLMTGYGIVVMATADFKENTSPWHDPNSAAGDYLNWRLCSSEPPDDDKRWPSIGNGHIATVVHSDTVYMNGLYNGNGSTSTRARIPAYISLGLNVTSGNIREKSYCLQMDNGLYAETYTGDHWNVDLKMYAHRTVSRILVTQVTITTDGQQSDLEIPLSSNIGMPSNDIRVSSSQDSGIRNATYVSGVTKEAEAPETGATTLHMYYSDIPAKITVEAGIAKTIQYTYLMSVSPFQQEAKSYFEQAQSMFTKGTLESSHVSSWRELWDAGRIDIYGNQFLARLTYSSLYYIYSALPTAEDKTWPFYGLSPADLAHNGYNGHMFWDQDTWMFPPILMLNPDVAESIVNARIRALKFAQENARRTGYKGARYPWESAMSGLEVTPAGYDSGPNEQHISGDVALAFRQYLMVTHDCNIIQKGNMKNAVFEIAEFWKSRVSYDEKRDVYEILGVMPPDEYQAKINNSVYTNYIAQKSLELPAFVCALLNCEAPADYADIAEKMYIPFDNDSQYHPEFDGYNKSVIVKQADVILLGWPLEMEINNQVRRNDLEIYANVTPGGPAMSWGMFTIGWLDIGETNKANKTFYRQQLNRRDPFNIWTENTDGYLGVTNFITGMGGYLHSLLFGYAGVRIREDGLLINCAVLPESSGFRLKELNYLDGVFDITCDQTVTKVTLLRSHHTMRAKLETQSVTLKINEPVSVARQRIIISGSTSACQSTEKNGAASKSFDYPLVFILCLVLVNTIK